MEISGPEALHAESDVEEPTAIVTRNRTLCSNNREKSGAPEIRQKRVKGRLFERRTSLYHIRWFVADRGRCAGAELGPSG